MQQHAIYHPPQTHNSDYSRITTALKPYYRVSSISVVSVVDIIIDPLIPPPPLPPSLSLSLSILHHSELTLRYSSPFSTVSWGRHVSPNVGILCVAEHICNVTCFRCVYMLLLTISGVERTDTLVSVQQRPPYFLFCYTLKFYLQL